MASVRAVRWAALASLPEEERNACGGRWGVAERGGSGGRSEWRHERSVRVSVCAGNIFKYGCVQFHNGERKVAEENVIYIGNKNVMSYVLAVVTQFHNGCEEVVLKARGRAISRAVDTAEVIRNKFMPNVQIKSIRTGTEELEGEGGQKISVSSIEIVLSTKQ